METVEYVNVETGADIVSILEKSLVFIKAKREEGKIFSSIHTELVHEINEYGKWCPIPVYRVEVRFKEKK